MPDPEEADTPNTLGGHPNGLVPTGQSMSHYDLSRVDTLGSTPVDYPPDSPDMVSLRFHYTTTTPNL